MKAFISACARACEGLWHKRRVGEEKRRRGKIWPPRKKCLPLLSESVDGQLLLCVCLEGQIPFISLAPELARGCLSKDKYGRACKSRYLCNGTAYLQESRQAAVRQLRYSQLAKEQGGASRGGRYRRYRATRRAERKTPGPEKGAPPGALISRNATGELGSSSQGSAAERNPELNSRSSPKGAPD